MEYIERNPRMVEEMNKAKQRLPKLYDEACGDPKTPPALLESLCRKYIMLLEDSEAPDVEEIIRAGEKGLSALESAIDNSFHLSNQPMPEEDEEKILDGISRFASIFGYLFTTSKNCGEEQCKTELVDRHRKILEKWFFALSEHTAEFFYKLWKRIRKYNGLLTGITQNVDDCIRTHVGKDILANSEFLLMMRQTPSDAAALADLLHISENQISHLLNANPGDGLMKVGSAIVPFVDKFPADTELYRIMSTNPREAKKS